MRSGEHRQRAFTLVEVIVVAGILILLMSILMPTLARAREHATRVRCESNLRQILLACQNYANNWGTACPWPNWHGPELAGYCPVGWLYQYPQGATSAAVQSDVQSGALYGFLSTCEVFHCPEDSAPYTAGPPQMLTSYLMNGATCGYGKRLPAYQITMFQPDAIMFWEASPSSPSWTGGSVYPSQGITTRHSNGGSIGCYDGHVEWMSSNDYANEEVKLPGRLWCNPGSAGGN